LPGVKIPHPPPLYETLQFKFVIWHEFAKIKHSRKISRFTVCLLFIERHLEIILCSLSMFHVSNSVAFLFLAQDSTLHSWVKGF
jgi:hypothetical protein